VIVVRFALHLRAHDFSLISIAKRASDGSFQRVLFSSSFLSKYATYANLRVLSSSVKTPARLILLHKFVCFEQSFIKAELLQ
jgi:hypothetical protein